MLKDRQSPLIGLKLTNIRLVLWVELLYQGP